MTTNQHQWRYTTAHHPAQALPRTHGVVVALRDRGSIERVGLDDVGTSHEVLLVDASDDVRLRQIEDVVVASQVRVMVCEPFAAVVLLHKLVLLDHGAHRAVVIRHPRLEELRDVRAKAVAAAHERALGVRRLRPVELGASRHVRARRHDLWVRELRVRVRARLVVARRVGRRHRRLGPRLRSVVLAWSRTWWPSR